jgi:hypothetical protein
MTPYELGSLLLAAAALIIQVFDEWRKGKKE